MLGIEENALIYDKSGKQIGNLQAERKIVVIPNSRHNSGGTYKISPTFEDIDETILLSKAVYINSTEDDSEKS